MPRSPRRWTSTYGCPQELTPRPAGSPAARTSWPDGSNMTIEIWDRQPLREQERVIGRTKAEGAPLSGGNEFDQPDFTMKGRGDEPLVATDAHVRMVHSDNNGGAKMLRRGYNFVDGSNGLGRMDAGLFFLAFLRDPRTHFIPIQTKIGR